MICERCKRDANGRPASFSGCRFCSSSSHHRQDCAEGCEGEVTVRSLVAEGVSSTASDTGAVYRDWAATGAFSQPER